MRKHFIGDCISNPFENDDALNNIVDSGIEIEKKEFMKACNVDKPNRFLFREFPHDYTFFRTPDKSIYWFKWSAIEFFYE
jgi:hypothetical protein